MQYEYVAYICQFGFGAEDEKTAPDSATQSGEISGGDGGESNSPSKGNYPEYTTSLVSSFILPG